LKFEIAARAFRNYGFLAGNCSHLDGGRIERLRILNGLTETHVDYDLLQPWHLVEISITQLFHELWYHFAMVALL